MRTIRWVEHVVHTAKEQNAMWIWGNLGTDHLKHLSIDNIKMDLQETQGQQMDSSGSR
jgi:hypothetical protein